MGGGSLSNDEIQCNMEKRLINFVYFYLEFSYANLKHLKYLRVGGWGGGLARTGTWLSYCHFEFVLIDILCLIWRNFLHGINKDI